MFFYINLLYSYNNYNNNMCMLTSILHGLFHTGILMDVTASNNNL